MSEADSEDVLDTLDDLLWLIEEMENRAAASLADLLADCEARGIRCTPAILGRLIARGQAEGLVEIWEHEGAGYATLTPLAADRLGVRLSYESDRWFPRGQKIPDTVIREPWEVELPDVEDFVSGDYRPGDEHRPGRSMIDPAVYIDPSLPEPIDVIIEDEEYGTLIGPGQRRLRDGSQVVIHHVHGINARWPEALKDIVQLIEGDGFIIARRLCGGCHQDRTAPRARYSRNSYCAICDRSGVDGKFPAIEKDLRQDGPKLTTPARFKPKGGAGVDVHRKASKRGRGQIPAVA